MVRQFDGTAFKNVTVLDGVTIKGGSAQETVGTKENFFGDRGAGVYMAGNAYLTNCVVTENAATGKGGGVYLYGGRIIGSLLYNNEGQQGGAVYVDNSGIVLRSMLTNNSGYDGLPYIWFPIRSGRTVACTPNIRYCLRRW